jgi:glycosyltransferase involved in cell wall biosynthesis
METSLANLIADDVFRQGLQARGLETASCYSVERAVLSELSLFRSVLHERELNRYRKFWPFRVSAETPLHIAVWPCVMGDIQEPAGSAYIRLLQPLTSKSIADRLKLNLIKTVSDLDTAGADLCVVQRNAIKDVATVNLLVQQCQSNGIKLVHEIDDDLFNIEEKSVSSIVSEELAALRLLTAKADAVITSTEALQQELETINPRVYCIPNALDEDLWYGSQTVPVPEKNTPLKLLYMGSKTHGEDLGLVVDAWRRIEAEYEGRVSLDIIGGATHGSLGFGNHIRVPPALTYPVFVRWLREQGPWDIGIIPLRDTPFNRKKSPIKFLDYAALGLAIVCSDMPTYRDIASHEENALLVQNTSDDWYSAIRKLIEDRDLRERLSASAHSNVRQEYCLDERAESWIDVFSIVING